MAGVADARKVAPSEIEPLPMTPTKQKEEDGLPKVCSCSASACQTSPVAVAEASHGLLKNA